MVNQTDDQIPEFVTADEIQRLLTDNKRQHTEINFLKDIGGKLVEENENLRAKAIALDEENQKFREVLGEAYQQLADGLDNQAYLTLRAALKIDTTTPPV